MKVERAPQLPKFKAIIKNGQVVETGNETRFTSILEANGYKLSDKKDEKGYPIFEGVVGPMFDYNMVLYECNDVYREGMKKKACECEDLDERRDLDKLDDMKENTETAPNPVKAPPKAPPKKRPTRRGPTPGRRNLPTPRPKAGRTDKETRLVRSIISRYNSLVVSKAQLNEGTNIDRSDLKRGLGQNVIDIINADVSNRVEQYFESKNLPYAGVSFQSVSAVMMDLQTSINQILPAEQKHKSQLEKLAIETVRELHPYIDAAGIKINAFLGPISQEIQKGRNCVNCVTPEENEKDLERLKRRVINAITQGGAHRSQSMHHMSDTGKVMSEVDTRIIDLNDKYTRVIGGILSINDLMVLMVGGQGAGQGIPNTLQQQAQQPGGAQAIMGYNYIDQDPETGEYIIHAFGIVYPVLLHEIVKGLYEIIGMAQFAGKSDKEIEDILAYDKLSHEPVDISAGATIYSAVIGAIYEHGGNAVNSLTREIALQHIYELPAKQFLTLIGNIITQSDQPTTKKMLASIADQAERTASEWDNYSYEDEYEDDYRDDDDLDDIDLDSLFESKYPLYRFKEYIDSKKKSYASNKK